MAPAAGDIRVDGRSLRGLAPYMIRKAGVAAVAFDHDPEHQRYAQSGPTGVTLYIQAMGVLAERFGQLGGPQRWTNYLIVGGRLIGIQVENADETTLTRYFHTDHLGSIAVITDEAGVVTQRLSVACPRVREAEPWYCCGAVLSGYDAAL